MTTRDELYAKFGITAEAAQLLETELGTLLLAVNGLENNWHIAPNQTKARQTLDQIEAHTLGVLLVPYVARWNSKATWQTALIRR